MRTALFLILAAIGLSCSPKMSKSGYKLLAGTYTKKGSDGIYFYELDKKMRNPNLLSKTSKIQNPSFLTLKDRVIYAVNEEEKGLVQAFELDKEKGDFNFLNQQKTGGAHPCHVSFQDGLLFVGNYSGGNLAVFPIESDGKIGTRSQLISNAGSGPNKDRQEKPHIHSANVSPDGKNLWVADLGTDEVLVFDILGKEIKEKVSIKMKPGSGPRHISFHPNQKVAYVINELDNTIAVINTLTYKIQQSVSTLPDGFSGKSFCADIHVSPDGKFLYGSNRYSDTIVCFKINEKMGELTLISHTDTGGKVPRNFNLSPDGKFLLVANQDSDNITVFSRNRKTGILTKTNTEIKVSMPVCLVFE